MPKIDFTRWYRHKELGELLQSFAKEYPNLIELEVIGQSFEKRDIWLLNVTNKKTAPHLEKPAFWVDGNIHSTELSASMAVLHLLRQLCEGYGKNPQVTHLLDTRAVYLVPRINPDGAELAINEPLHYTRSSVRPYPYDETLIDGVDRSDVDGDGQIALMRIKDPAGAWKISERQPRLMEKRKPTDFGGTYYRLIPEGTIRNWDGMTIPEVKRKGMLDMNRNYPSAWRPEGEQKGAGEYPMSEPEIRAVVEAAMARPNLTGAILYHTFSGVYLRAPARYSDSGLIPEDLWTFKEMGAKATAMTGYPAISEFDEFKYHPSEVMSGTGDDFFFEQRGVYSWTCEIWSPQRAAGIEKYQYVDWFRDHPFDDDVKLLKFSDQKLGGKGHIEWKKFKHPQLGEVEIGGWNWDLMIRNPPPEMREKEIAPLTEYAIWQALASPLLEHRETRVEKFDGGAGARVRVAAHNTGWLPTHVTFLAAKKKFTRGVIAEVRRVGEDWQEGALAPPAWLKGGSLRQHLGELAGANHVASFAFAFNAEASTQVAVADWVLAPGKYEVEIKHERAGVVRVELEV